METADIQASLQSPLFSRLDEDGDRRCDLIWASPVTFHFFPLCVLKRCSPLPLYFEPKPNLSKTLNKGLLICVSCQYHLRNIAKIRKYLSEDTSQILVHAFISSKLDNCNSLLYGLPKHLLNRLRLIQNTAARIVTLSKRFDHITPILFKLHWLPLGYRIHFKILLLVYKCLNGLAPTYLSELLRYTNGPRLLRSSSQNFLAVPRTRLKTYGDRAFSAAAPRLWNQLPPELRSVTSVDQFRTQLKTYLFKLAYDV